MKPWLAVGILSVGLVILSGCGTVGKDFDLELARSIVNGKTTEEQVQEMFGEPFKTGIQNGRSIWVYEKSTYQLLGEDSSKNLIIEFDSAGVVRNHQIMSNVPRSE